MLDGFTSTADQHAIVLPGISYWAGATVNIQGSPWSRPIKTQAVTVNSARVMGTLAHHASGPWRWPFGCTHAYIRP